MPAGDERVSKKIARLRAEGIPEEQAVATALAMERAGRLDEDGGYKAVDARKATVLLIVPCS